MKNSLSPGNGPRLSPHLKLQWKLIPYQKERGTGGVRDREREREGEKEGGKKGCV